MLNGIARYFIDHIALDPDTADCIVQINAMYTEALGKDGTDVVQKVVLDQVTPGTSITPGINGAGIAGGREHIANFVQGDLVFIAAKQNG